MNADKLNKAINEYARMCSIDVEGYEAIKQAIQYGVELIMQQPLTDRLTDEEKEKIRELYNKAQKDTYDNTIKGVIKCTISAVVMNCLIGIFGKDLFNEK